MGCDIHLYIERREWRVPSDLAVLAVLHDAIADHKPVELVAQLRAQLSPGEWIYVRPPPRDLEKYPRKGDGWGARSYGPSDCMHEDDTRTAPHWYTNRNYTLFHVLAGVRTRNEDMPTIAEPRGLPSDVSALVASEYSGDHSASWLTVEEILTWPGWSWKAARSWRAAPPELDLRSYCSDFLAFVEEFLRPLGDAGDVRIVFGFDN